MDPQTIVAEVRAYFESHASPQGIATAQRFFKEPIRTYGLPAKEVQTLAARYRRRFKAGRAPSAGSGQVLADVMAVADELIQSGAIEEVGFAVSLLAGFEREFDRWTHSPVRWRRRCLACCPRPQGPLPGRRIAGGRAIDDRCG